MNTDIFVAPMITIAVSAAIGCAGLVMVALSMIGYVDRATEALEKIERRLYRMSEEK